MIAQSLTPGIGSQVRFASASSAVVDVQAEPSSDMASTRNPMVEAPSDLPNLDFLRTIAVLLVFVGHLMLTAGVRGLGDVGHLGVLLFFVHTSLVLMLSMERLDLTGGKLYTAFLIRRFFRIYPLSVLAVLSALAFHIPSVSWVSGYLETGWRENLSNIFLIQNITHSGSILAVLWSLPFEVQMYAILPLLFIFMRRSQSLHVAMLTWAVAVVIASLEYIARSGSDMSFILTRYVPCFLAGVIAWRAMKSRNKSLPGWLWIVALIAFVASYRLADAIRVYGLGSLFALHAGLRTDHRIWWPQYLDLVRDWVFSGITGLAIPLFAQIGSTGINLISKSVAKYSYGIYICHIPILWLCFARFHIISAIVAAAVSVVLTGITAFVLYHWLEEPAIRMGKRAATRFVSRRQSSQIAPKCSNDQEDRFCPAMEPSVRILGSRVHLVSVRRTVDYMEQWIGMRDGRCRQVVVTGFHGLSEARKNPFLRTVLNQADLWVPDGIAPIWVARLRGRRNAMRATGSDILREFFGRAQDKSFSSYFYGDTERTLGALTETVAHLYPRHRVAGSCSPPFRALSAAEDQAIIDRINDAHPDVLWVALGMPRQDVWIHERLHRLNVPVAIGVGAAFAFVAGTVSRCPDWMGNAGFESVYRFVCEPGKLWRRDLIDGPRFIYHVGMELLRSRES
jgi:N-acetylglucosaminyldiphosphoundecaprenol N-acetyl-beta-D-mannosaminyltransferase